MKHISSSFTPIPMQIHYKLQQNPNSKAAMQSPILGKDIRKFGSKSHFAFVEIFIKQNNFRFVVEPFKASAPFKWLKIVLKAK